MMCLVGLFGGGGNGGLCLCEVGLLLYGDAEYGILLWLYGAFL